MADQGTTGKAKAQLFERLWFLVAFYCVLTIGLLLLLNLPGRGDYVGSDDDDVMRLVEVRDLLAGQSWFDLTQYRLGLDGGTLMHWSRLIDLPIAVLIRALRPFMSPAGVRSGGAGDLAVAADRAASCRRCHRSAPDRRYSGHADCARPCRTSGHYRQPLPSGRDRSS